MHGRSVEPVLDFRRHELAALLRSRRFALRPEDVNLPRRPGRRKDGLRMEDVAELANVSLSWYARFEAGHPMKVAPATLDAVARALGLTNFERTHLFAVTETPMPSAEPEGLLPIADLRTIVDGHPGTPAVACDHRLNVLASNELARCLLDLQGDEEGFAGNSIWRMFALPGYRERAGDEWDAHASLMTLCLRRAYAKYYGDPYLEALIRELWANMPDFPRFWNEPVATPASVLHLTLRDTNGEAKTFVVDLVTAQPERHPDMRLTHFLFRDQSGIAMLKRLARERRARRLSRAS